MKFFCSDVKIQSKISEEVIDLTPQVQAYIKETGVINGIVHVQTNHTSSGLTVTEGIPCLEADMLSFLRKIAPEEGNYRHKRYLDFDGRLGFNADAHLKSILSGYFVSFPIRDGSIVKGSRQTIYFLEFDGPLERTCVFTVIGV